MGEISIKINIGDRVYPLKVEMQEEEQIRKAAKNVNEHMRSLQQMYDVRDKQDLLSMSLLHYASAALKYDDKKIIEDNGLSEQLDVLHERLDTYLSDKNVL
ncbi:MAG TPA: cell division protein ZapA [Anseongella sp.]|nr:cell division protein ZapA [Anseongella sp.]